MSGMVSSTSATSTTIASTSGRRKPPEERRAEIVAAAAAIALDEGLERVTLRAVAGRLGVRPGLISHYFSAAEDLVAAGFAYAISDERNRLVPLDGTPLERIARLVLRVRSAGGIKLAKLWLNARHLARFSAPVALSIEEQEALDRAQLRELIAAGVRSGDFVAEPGAATVRILVAIDGFGAYVNNPASFDEPAFTEFVADVVSWALELDADVLREAMAAQA